ncbi:OmpA family protein [Nocardiopsis sp. NPDC006832]|uniref:OmpA family protein n=1 Tax=Nocardiopsis sp. NPDC006832 TaxID=3157188 RepID=UPI0033DE5706
MIPTNPTSQRSYQRRIWPAAASTALLLFVSGCVTSSDPQGDEGDHDPSASPEASAPPEGQSGNEVIASSITTSSRVGSELQIDVYALERLESDLLRLRIGITNNSSDPFDLGFGLSEENHLTASDISLIDDANQKRYLSYNQSSGQCFCNQLDGSIGSGNTETLWVIYPEPPGDLESMTILTPMSPPMMDIPITEASESIENANLEEPRILDLSMISDSLKEDQTGRAESAEEVSIILSSDVLFDTNSSDLTDDAQEILEQVAQEIDDAGSSVVSVDGHADDTGNDSINLPLSKERAESVESTLDELITRQGITFEVEGHGSANPIADNETEEGRERNRRVSVTFEK